MENKMQTVQINTQDITVKEFQGKRVVTLKDIDSCHNRPEGTARNRQTAWKNQVKGEGE